MSLPYTGILVVGASAAGLGAADGLREGGFTGRITVLDAELEPSYDRPMLSKGLLATSNDGQPSALRTRAHLEENQIEVMAGHAAMGLDIDRGFVVTSYGEAIPWAQVVVATGVRARPLLSQSGNPLPTLRTRDDLEIARVLARGDQPIGLIGGGFIGLEVAASLRSRGLDVTVFDAAPTPLLDALGPIVSGWLGSVHEQHGVRFHLGAGVTSVAELETGYSVHLTDGSTHDVGGAMAGLGTEPSTDWLVGAGVDLDGGIRTDVAGRTNVPGVWAAGDVANSFDAALGAHRRVEHWTHAVEHGRHVGLNVARGGSEPFDAVPYFWTEQYDVTLHVVGHRRPGDEDIVLEGSLDSADFVVVHGSEGQLHAVTVSHRVNRLRTYKKLLRSNASLEQALATAI